MAVTSRARSRHGRIADAGHYPHETDSAELLPPMQTFLSSTAPFQYSEASWVDRLTYSTEVHRRTANTPDTARAKPTDPPRTIGRGGCATLPGEASRVNDDQPPVNQCSMLPGTMSTALGIDIRSSKCPLHQAQ